MPSPWKPEGYTSLSPYLMCPDPEALIAFIAAAFAGRLLRRFDRPDGTMMHAEMLIDDTVVMIGGDATGIERGPAHLHLYAPDAASCFARAIAAGATVVQPLQRKDAEDDLRGGVQDASGTTWWIASQ